MVRIIYKRKYLMSLEIQVSSKKLTDMKVDCSTKIAFITNKKGEIKIFDFKDVKKLKISFY